MVCALGPPIALKVEQRKTTDLQEYGLITLRNYNTVSEEDGGWIFSAGPDFFGLQAPSESAATLSDLIGCCW